MLRLQSLFAALVTALAISACATPAPRERLFCNGTIYLGAPDWTKVEALLVRDGRVVAAGSREELERQSPDAERIDLHGWVAVPGLQDAHGHFEGLGATEEWVDLRDCRSFAKVIELVVERAKETPKGSWIRARGWDQNLWNPPEFPTHEALSAAVPDHPVLLERVDGHAAIANLAAMRVAGVDGPRESEAFDAGSPILQAFDAGGRVLLGADKRPTGVFIDDACRLVERAVPPPTREQRKARFLEAQVLLLGEGLTAVHDMGIDREGIEILRELRDEGRLHLRAIEYLSGGAAMDERTVAGLPLAPDERDMLSVVGVKLYADGALGSRGAALLEPYHDEPTNSGLTLLSQEELEHAIAVCAAQGLQPAVHAIGDRANRMVLDAYAKQLARDPKFRELRLRVEHAQVVSPQDWARFEELGAIASMQPTHATSDMPWAPARLGPERIRGAYAWRRLVKDPSLLAFGSDFPVEPCDPLDGVYSAITCARPDGTPAGGFLPDQRLSAREAFSAFTFGAARAARQEDRRGRLAPGYFADMTVFPFDPLECEPAKLLREEATQVIINGECVLRKFLGCFN
ncbi:MAG: amidohydrolase [Planctomycetaceae bacterium]|nr:amidohydrolase [Planctomycetaceae bacterium]